MSIQRRRNILQWASESGGWIVEDDYDSELHYGGNLAYPSLQGMDSGNNVIYVGTFSKSLFPGCDWATWSSRKSWSNLFRYALSD